MAVNQVTIQIETDDGLQVEIVRTRRITTTRDMTSVVRELLAECVRRAEQALGDDGKERR
jgi:hypothetical protein